MLNFEPPDHDHKSTYEFIAGKPGAERYWATARTLIETREEAWSNAEVLRLQGELLLQQAQPDYQAAVTCLQQGLDLSRRQSAKVWELRTAHALRAFQLALFCSTTYGPVGLHQPCHA